MKTKKKGLALALAVLWVACMAGCGKQTDTSGIWESGTLETRQTAETTSQEPESSGERDIQNQKESAQDPPEGYVYDYQVSLEPIPQEIADLGGPCVGTMHAFPTRIRVGLMKQQMEEDSELKKEAEQKAEEVRKRLEEEIGGEFELELMWIENAGWRFLGREVGTDYKFTVTHVGIADRIDVPEYYDKINAGRYEEDMSGIIFGVYGDCCQNTWLSETESHRIMYVCIANFADEGISYREEQDRVLELWKGLQEYGEDMRYRIYIEFYPTEYEGMVREKYREGTLADLSLPKKSREALKLNGEIYDILDYDNVFGGKGEVNMDSLLEERENGTYDETKKWDYWIGGNN